MKGVANIIIIIIIIIIKFVNYAWDSFLFSRKEI